MLLAPAGLREWGGSALILGLIVGTLWLTPVPHALAWTATGLATVVWLGIAGFFRDPPRRVPGALADEAMLSPADGRVTVIERLDHHEATDGPAVLVRIFLSVLDVHINRMPCSAVVRDTTYTPGQFLDARKAESAQVNESMLIRVHRDDGVPLGVRQVSGAIARRIVCPLEPGDRFDRGERFGMIKFGSTTELIVPEGYVTKVHVSVGDVVRAGRTVMLEVAGAAAT